jgi:predicted phosphodiesterase
MTEETQREVYEYDPPLNYTPFTDLIQLIHNEKPDLVVNLGDFTEPFYEEPRELPILFQDWVMNDPSIRYVKVLGNHDRDDGVDHFIDGQFRYEHGHKLGPTQWSDARSEYIENLRKITLGSGVVHGHTHEANIQLINGIYTLDVGSVTFSGSCGIIEDGVPRIHMLRGYTGYREA